MSAHYAHDWKLEIMKTGTPDTKFPFFNIQRQSVHMMRQPCSPHKGLTLFKFCLYFPSAATHALGALDKSIYGGISGKTITEIAVEGSSG